MTDESTKKIKGIALSSKSSSKALKAKVIESEDEASEEGHEVESEDEEEMVLMAAKVSQWAKRSKKYAGKFGGSSKKVGATKEKKEEQNKCFKCNKPGHFIVDCPENQSRSSKRTSSKEKYKSKLKKGFLATWEDLDKDLDSDGDEEANLALMATTSDKENSEHEADSDSEDEDEDGTKSNGQELAIKTYRTSVLAYKDKVRYVDGDRRFTNDYCGSNHGKMVKTWAKKEMRNLLRVKAEGIMCPTPYLLKEHVLVMEFIGVKLKFSGCLIHARKDGCAAPRLKDANLSLDKLRKGYVEGHLYIIDVSQAVDPDHPRALKFLIQDCIHVSDFFKRHGVGVLTVIELFVFIFDASIVDSAVANYLEDVQQKILTRGDVSIEDEIADHKFAKDYIAKKLVDAKIMSGDDILDLYHRMIPGLKDQQKHKSNTIEDSCVISDGEYDLLEGDVESQSGENEDNESNSEEISSSESDTDTIEHSQVIFDGESNLLKGNAESQSDEDEDIVSDSKEISSYESDQVTPLMKKAARKEARKENKKKVKEEKRQERKTKVPKAVKKRKLKKSKAPKTR
ncbi:serine/threonine-protein kinase rio1 [Trifolium repens]|nr:serine/threonine-protein kinase rio1 [Trifolium repens]